jgi:AcrR family transcriptional regulator
MIIKAVIESLAEKGLYETTFERVGRKVKMHRAHIAYYFPSHRDMIVAAIGEVIKLGQRMTVEQINRARTPRGQLEAFVTGAFGLVERNRYYGPLFSLLLYLASHDPAYRLVNTEIRKIGVERISPILRSYYADRPLPEETIWKLAKALQAIVFGNLVEALSTHSFADLEAAKQHTIETLFAALDSYRHG